MQAFRPQSNRSPRYRLSSTNAKPCECPSALFAGFGPGSYSERCEPALSPGGAGVWPFGSSVASTIRRIG